MIAPDTSLGVVGVRTVSVTDFVVLGAMVRLAGLTVPKGMKFATLAPNRTVPVVPPSALPRLQMYAVQLPAPGFATWASP